MFLGIITALSSCKIDPKKVEILNYYRVFYETQNHLKKINKLTPVANSIYLMKSRLGLKELNGRLSMAIFYTELFFFFFLNHSITHSVNERERCQDNQL